MYPNLEMIEKKANIIFSKVREPGTVSDFEADVFLQLWGNTCLGFDVDEEGNGYFGGQAMTEAYTTVMHERKSDIYFVFFGEEPCYMVTSPTEAFFKDLKDRKLVSKSKAKGRY